MNRYLLPLVVALTVGATAPALAQEVPRNNQELEKLLELSPEQKKRIAMLDAKYQPRVKALDNKYLPKAQELQRQLAELQKRYLIELKPVVDQRSKEIDTILTPLQRDKRKKLDSQVRQRIMALQQQQLKAAGTAPKR